MSDMDILSAQHSPALRVGGRRLSITARPRTHHVPTFAPAATDATENTDYPRPAAAQGDEHNQPHPPPHNEEEPPKENKHGHGGHDTNRLKESVYHKLEATMPSKDQSASKHAFGAAGRIGQPMGKALAV